MRQVSLVWLCVVCLVMVSGCGQEKTQPEPSKEAATTTGPQAKQARETKVTAEEASSAAKPSETAAPAVEAAGAEAKPAPTEAAPAEAPSAEVGAAATEEAPKYPKEYIGKDGMKMVLIPAGRFDMGSTVGASDESPVHPVELDAFYMDVYEVTNALYKKFMDATGHPAPRYWNDAELNGPNQPVVGVTWEDAKAYCEWAGERLPTEAEWEYAARGGLSGKIYPWGDEPPDAGGTFRANYFSRGPQNDGYAKTAPVGSFPPNGYGLYDMAGNVWEWCADWYYEHWYTYEKQLRNPQGPTDEYAKVNGYVRVRRGGAWSRYAKDLTCANRANLYPKNSDNMTGFRCVVSASEVHP